MSPCRSGRAPRRRLRRSRHRLAGGSHEADPVGGPGRGPGRHGPALPQRRGGPSPVPGVAGGAGGPPWGDGGGAVILEASDEPGILSTHIHADGAYEKLLHVPSGVSHQKGKSTIEMQGNQVFKIAVNTLDSIVDETLEMNQLDKSDIDWLVPHQANIRILEATAKKLNMSMDRVIVTIDRHGNTSAASIPLALDTAIREGKIKRGETLLMEAFGGGFTWGSALIKY